MIFEKLLHFFVDNFPSSKAILFMGPVYLAWCTGVLWFAGRMKQRGVKTGYTRKIFHFLIFGTVVILQWLLGTDAVLLFGAMCSLLVFYAVYRGDGHIFYEALAREKDAPRRRWFVLLPWLTTGIGGVAGNLFFGHLAIAGYLVTGGGDAIGEPAGTRFGRHPYKVWSLSKVPAIRTLEGSAAVFLASFMAILLAVLFLPELNASPSLMVKAAVIALVAACTEAITPHGWDNATMQLIPTALVQWWMT